MATLQVGSSGSAVRDLQQKLGVAVDGVFGPITRAALIKYQSSHGLVADGIAGPLTMAKLNGTTTTTTTAAKTSTATTDAATTRAAGYGWSLAVINSNPELKRLFTLATQQDWTTDKFVAMVRGTAWFQTTSDAARQALILQKADPQTYNARVTAAFATGVAIAGSMGANLTTAQMKQVATDAVTFGWNQDQIKQHMVAFVTTGTGGQYTGGAASYQYQYNQLASQYGLTVSPQTLGGWVQQSIAGSMSPDQVKNWMITNASSKYPSLAPRLKAGETIMDIANPYIQSYSNILEVNPNSVNLSDPLIQSALSGVDPKTGQPMMKSVWQFEQDLRNDPRYMNTKQAKDAVYSMGHQVLKDFGMMS